MYTQKFEEFPPPPGVMGSLRAGFDAVSSHIGLILLPVVLDLFLWLGPRLSVERLVNPLLQIVFDQARLALTSSADLKQFAEFQSIFSEVLETF